MKMSPRQMSQVMNARLETTNKLNNESENNMKNLKLEMESLINAKMEQVQKESILAERDYIKDEILDKIKHNSKLIVNYRTKYYSDDEKDIEHCLDMMSHCRTVNGALQSLLYNLNMITIDEMNTLIDIDYEHTVNN